MNLYIWFSFLLAAMAIAISPGNGALLSMAHGLAYGFCRTHITVLGLQFGLVMVMLISGLGLGALLKTSPRAFLILKLSGGIYLIYLGWQQIRSAKTNNSLSPVAHSDILPSAWSRFLQGFICDITNAKGIVFMVAMLPQFMEAGKPILGQLAILIVTMVFVDTVVMHGYALLASKMAHLLRNPRARMRLNYVFGIVLVLVGLSVFFVSSGN